MKTTTSYWNPLALEQRNQRLSIEGLETMAEELTLDIDPDTGEYTRLACTGD